MALSLIITNFKNTFSNLWFRDTNEDVIYMNDIAVRIRAGLFLAIPLFMGLTLYEALYTSYWLPIENTDQDTFETDWDGNIIYAIEATRRTYDYSLQTYVLIYAFVEMLAGMFVFTARFSPTILISSFLAKSQKPVWKPLVPKRYAWGIGASLISICIVFFNPEILAEWINNLVGSEYLPTTENYVPFWLPTNLVFVCFAFMWLEAVLGLCVGCKVYALLVKLGIHKEECDACNNIDWDEIATRNATKKNN
jgi:hypothetical protein